MAFATFATACYEDGGDVPAEKSLGVDDMSLKGALPDASRAMRVGVIGAGVMGTNHARVLGGLPNITLVGIVDPLSEHRARAVEHAGCRAFETLEPLNAPH